MSGQVGDYRGRGYAGGPYNTFGGFGGYNGYGQMGPFGGFGYGGLDPRLAQLYGYPFSPFANLWPGYEDDEYEDYGRMQDYNSGFVNGVHHTAMMVQMGGGGGWSGGGRYGGSGWGGRGGRGYGGGHENCSVVLGVFLEGARIVAVEQP
ncbi:hypothetical protein LTR27_008349 [Elasticomyces elasticus]|nr:hypothetical protein LTR27_008349 [Elasticomyces elasticus]